MKAYQNDWRYNILKKWCDASVRSLFGTVSSDGKEDLPTDGAIILAPNHCNTLMDALVVLQDFKEPTLFGARADVFRKPLLNKFLRFLRILPIARVRDGLQEVLHNHETMDEVTDALEHGARYCMFCEGTHRTKHSLLPLKKGIVRTALQAHHSFGDRKPVYIVPMGLEYEDYFRLQTDLHIRYGEPINVSAFVAAHPELGEAEIYRHLLAELRERMSALITYLPDDETYPGRWGLTKMAGQEAAMAADPALIDEAADFEEKRKAARLSMWSFGHTRPVLRTLGKLLVGLIFLPLILFAAVVTAPMWLVAAYVVHGLKDKAFTRTAQFAVKWLMTPLMIIVWALVFFLTLPFKQAFVPFLASLFSHSLFYEALNQGRILLSDIRLLFGFKDLKAQYARIAAKARALVPKTQTPEI